VYGLLIRQAESMFLGATISRTRSYTRGRGIMLWIQRPTSELSGATTPITRLMIDRAMSDRGGWSERQFKAIGSWPLKKGWKKELIGKIIPVEYYWDFLGLKNKHLKAHKKSV
jgi:hypothetical protein